MSDDGRSIDQIRAALANVLGSLSVRERQFIRQTFGIVLSEPPTPEELDALGKIPRDQIIAAEQHAIERLNRK